MTKIHVIGAASSAGASTAGCEDAPDVIRQSSYFKSLDLPLKWKATVHVDHSQMKLDAMQTIADGCDNIANLIQKAINKGRPFLTIGGDHSCAVGTWSGAAHAIRDQGDLGLIWIDAHMDAHTPDTSDTGNIHGMPIAHLLGSGDCALCHVSDDTPKIKPTNLALIGIRSYEPAEKALLERLNVKVYFIEAGIK